MCGYDKNLAALTFHPEEPTQKNFALDMRSLSNRTARTLLKEAEKCSLLCANCHAELHNPNLNRERFGGFKKTDLEMGTAGFEPATKEL